MECPHPAETSWLQQLPAGQITHYLTGEMLVVPHSQDNRVFVMESGRAKICIYGAGKEQILGYLQAGSVYVTHTPVWVEAVESCQLRSWPLSQVKSLFKAHPEMATGALRDVGMLMVQAIGLIEDLAFRSVEGRLARYLLTQARENQSPRLSLPGSTEALANLLGTSRQTLSSLLNRLEKEGVLARPTRQEVELLKIQKLQDLAQEMSAS
ncbi:Crp/Fnr family transcriptional regulator [Marinospirillum perlucidum]|uniref:Crp/Fnr family transcriptional regulator n=1 Tax=Marinospirillum perlucidum TaxID=1982602 RepID=UPI000DF4A6FB|nr:Crp/Fnr family transcriptional regulator [Marinospirillum perlucidum]